LEIIPTTRNKLILGIPFLKGRKIIYNYNYDMFKAKIYEDYNCLERNVEARLMFNGYLGFLAIFLFIFFRNFIVISVRKCCSKIHEE
jgi:hypothetical protein